MTGRYYVRVTLELVDENGTALKSGTFSKELVSDTSVTALKDFVEVQPVCFNSIVDKVYELNGKK